MASNLDSVDWQRSALFGTAAYVLGYLVIFVFTIIEDHGIDSDLWKWVGMFFYNSHFVDLKLAAGGQSIGFNMVRGTGPRFFSQAQVASTVPSFIWLLVPVVVLIGAGYMVATARDSQDAAIQGASITAVYLVLALLGTFVFTISDSSGSLGPKLSTSLLLAGIFYPAVFGAIGGAIKSNQ